MFRIGEVARQLGVHPDRLRKLEATGLFAATRDLASQRRYSTEDIATLRRILYPSAAPSSATTAPQGGTTTEANAHGA